MSDLEAFSSLISFFSNDILTKEVSPKATSFMNELKIPFLETEEISEIIANYTKNRDFNAAIAKILNKISINKQNIEKMEEFEKENEFFGTRIRPFIAFFALGTLKLDSNEENVIFITNLLTNYNSSIPKNVTEFIFSQITLPFISKISDKISIKGISHICSYFKSSLKTNPKAFKLLTDFLQRFYESNDEEYVNLIVPTVSEMIASIGNDTEKYDLSLCIKIAVERFEKCEKQIHNLLIQISRYVVDKSILRIMSNFPKFIYDRIETDFSLHYDKTDFPYTEVTYSDLQKYLFVFLDQSNYEVDINGLKSESSITFADIFGEDSFSMYSEAYSDASHIRGEYKKVIYDSLMNLLRKETKDVKYSVAVFMIEKFNMDINTTIFSILTSSPIFERSVSIFNCKLNDYTLFIRSYVIALSANLKQANFEHFINDIFSSPLAFVECILYMGHDLERFNDSVIFSEDMYRKLFLVSTKCYFIAKECTDDEYKRPLLMARMGLFIFIFIMLQSPRIPVFCFNSPFFVSLFIQVISESSFKKVLFTNLQSIFRDGGRIQTGVDFIEHAFDVLLLTDSMHPLGNELLQLLIDTISVSPDIAKKCTKILNIAISFLDKFRDKNTLTNVLSLMVYVYSLTDTEVKTDFMIKFAEIVIDIEPVISEIIKSKLLTIISGTPSFNPNSMTLIKRQKLTIMLYSIFSQSNCLPYFIEQISMYLKYSYYNKIAIQKVDFDILMLDMFIHFPNDFTFKGFKICNYKTRDELFASIPTLTLFLASKSNRVTADRILRIICPDKDMKVSKIAQDFASIIIPIVTKTEDEPEFFYPVSTTQEYVEFDNISIDSFANSSTMSFWIYVDDAIQEKNHFTSEIVRAYVKEEDDLFYIVYLEDFKLICCLYQELRISKFVLSENITTQQWNFVTISFLMDKSILKVYAQVNETNQLVSNVLFDESRTSPLVFKVGNSIKHFAERDEMLCGILIGSITLFKRMITRQERNRLYNVGMKESQFELECLFSFPGKHIEMECETVNIPPYEGYISSVPNIFDVFRHLYPLQMIVPVFRYFDFLPSTTSQLFIDILNYLYGPIIKHIFPLIPCILKTQRSDVLTYSLYQRFVLLIDKCDDGAALDSLYENILFNFEIWIRASAPQLQRICQHWANTLFQSYDYYKSYHFIHKTISNLRRFFYFDKIESCCSNIERDPKLNIDRCSSSIYRMLLEFASTTASPKDLDFIFISAADCKDFKQKEDLIYLGAEFARNIKCSEDATNALFSIDLDEYPLLFEAVIRALFIIGGEDKFLENMNMLSSRIKSPQNITITAQLLTEFPLLFPIALQISLFKDDDYKNMVIQTINDNCTNEFIETVRKSKWWMFWLLIFVAQTNESISFPITFFICKVLNAKKELDIETVDTLLNFIDLIQILMGIDLLQYKMSLITVLLGSHPNGLYKESFDAMFFYASREPMYKLLKDEYLKSPFPCDNEEYNSVEIKTLANFFDLFKSSKIYVRLVLFQKSSLYKQMDDVIRILRDANSGDDEVGPILTKYVDSDEETRASVFTYISENSTEIDHLTEERKNDLLNTANDFLNDFKKWTRDFAPSKLCDKEFTNLLSFSRNRQNEFDSIWRKIVRDQMHLRSFWVDAEYNKVVLKPSDHASPLFVSGRMKRITPIQSHKMKLNEQIPSGSFPCVRIKINSRQSGAFCLMRKVFTLYFETKKRVVSYAQVRHILIRGCTKIEFFMLSGRTILLDFAPLNASDILSRMSLLSIPNVVFFENMRPKKFVQKIGLFKRWQNGLLSNFQYILLFNIFFGKSYNDPDNQPVFPGCNSSDSIINDVLENHNFERSNEILQNVSNMTQKEVLDFLEKEFGYRDSAKTVVAKSQIDKAQGHSVSEDVWDRINIIPYQSNEIRTSLLLNSSAGNNSHFKMSVKTVKKEAKVKMPVFPFLKYFFINEKLVILTETAINYCSFDQVFTTRDYQGIIKYACTVNDNIIAFNPGTLDITVTNEKEMKTGTITVSDIGIVKADGPMVCIETNDGAISVFRFPDFSESYYSVKVFANTIKTYYPSYNHGVIAVITYDGYVNVYDMRQSRLINACFLTNKPITHIIITEVYGNIVVFSVDTIYVLTVNGTLISSTPLEVEATNVATWHGRDGKDWIAFSNSRYAINKFDSLSPNQIILVNTESTPIIDIQYIKQYNSLFWVNSAGLLTVKPN